MALSTARLGPIRSFEGKVGKRYEDLKLFVTSPNMDFIAPPPFGTRSIRMYSDFTFGLDDPLNTPQVFDYAVGHLALIASSHSLQSASHSGRWLFSIMPSEQDFKLLDHDNPSNALGSIKIEWRQIMEGEIKQFRRQVGTLRSEEFSKEVQHGVRDDQVIAAHLCRLKYYAGRLANPMARDEAFMLWRLTQRTCLELDARIAWVSEAREQFISPAAARSPLRNVIGAYVKNLDDAENLVRAGIPCWLVRPIDGAGAVRVDRWIEGPLTTREYTDAAVPNPIIFTGEPYDLERYRAMATFAHHRASPGSNWGVPSALPRPADAQSSPQPDSNQQGSLSSGGPSRAARSSSASRHQPYSLRTSRKKKPVNQDRDKFCDVDSPLVPRALRNWMEASHEIGQSFDQNSRSNPTVNRGYALPDPGVIAAMKNPVIRDAYITVYLKLRHALHYRLTSPMFEPLSTTTWRDLLGLETFQNKPNSYVAQRRIAVQTKLMDCINAGKLEGSIDLSKMGTAPVSWQDRPLLNPPPQNVISEILWELFEINFRYELVALDRLCYQFKPDNFERTSQSFDELDASSTGDREIRILSCIPHFNGRLIPEGPDVGRSGFASTNNEQRRAALLGLFRIMRGWTQMGEMTAGTIQRASAIESGENNGTRILDEFEYRLASHYVWCFVEWFRRAPVLPHGL